MFEYFTPILEYWFPFYQRIQLHSKFLSTLLPKRPVLILIWRYFCFGDILVGDVFAGVIFVGYVIAGDVSAAIFLP